ncbi:MAG: PD-(D/E)XK nuclease family protein [Chloroflexi bacterium]|nr:PD-(D/E)XK nuclease family protein [Chloroflexota bacterium]
MPPLVISAKNLGSFAIEGACRRCLWIGLHVKPLPYQTFPGIFSSIDAYNKRIVHQYFDREGKMPSWLTTLGDVENYVEPPSYHKFSYHEPDLDVTIRGTPDGVFKMRDGSYTIVDYKTAKYTPGQERLLPIYRAQLNGYALLGNRLDLGPVTQIALVYMEPVTDQDTAALPEMVNGRGFTLGLSATVVPVDLDPDGMIPRLMRRAKEVYDLAAPPEPGDACKDCSAVLGLTSLLRR